MTKNMEIEGSISSPTRFGQLTKHIFDEYPVYQFHIPSIIIDQYFPDRFYAFTSTTSKSLVKRFVVFSKPIVHATRRQLSNNSESSSESLSLNEILKELLSINDSTIRYNFVIMDDRLILIQVPSIKHVSYYALCKHITLTNRARYVRFAGQIWCDEDNNLVLNNNSGSYRPSDGLLEQAVNFFNCLVPELSFEGVSFRTSSQPSIKGRLKIKVKRKFSINHEAQLV